MGRGVAGFGWLTLALALSAAEVPAAEIGVETTDIDGRSVSFIAIEGDLEYGDEKRFVDLAIGLPEAIVHLASAGGNLHAGIEIGRAIRLKGYATFVSAPYSCASACALAWLGGTPRLMSEDGAVGFHAAWSPDGTSARPDSVGNALVGAYLNQLGLTPNAIAYVTGAQPEGMQWLTFEDAEAVGIEVVALGPPDAIAERAPPETPPADDWTSYAAWIQIYSRQSLNEAIELGMAYRREFAGTFVFRYDNGWYVVALGPYSDPLVARRERDRLVRSSRIPKDSLVNDGSRFLELTWGASPERPAVASRPSREDAAIDLAQDYFATWSGTAATAMDFLDRAYAPQVEYFGKRISRAEVLREKQAFVARWPERRYTLRRGMDVRCGPDGLCVVHGLVDWQAYSGPRNATSTGTASFTLSLRVAGAGATIVGETSRVLSRQTRKGR